MFLVEPLCTYLRLLFLQVTELPPTYQEVILLIKSGGYPVQCQVEDLLGLSRNALSGKGWTNVLRSRFRVYMYKKKTGQ